MLAKCSIRWKYLIEALVGALGRFKYKFVKKYCEMLTLNKEILNIFIIMKSFISTI